MPITQDESDYIRVCLNTCVLMLIAATTSEMLGVIRTLDATRLYIDLNKTSLVCFYCKFAPSPPQPRPATMAASILAWRHRNSRKRVHSRIRSPSLLNHRTTTPPPRNSNKFKTTRRHRPRRTSALRLSMCPINRSNRSNLCILNTMAAREQQRLCGCVRI